MKTENAQSKIMLKMTDLLTYRMTCNSMVNLGLMRMGGKSIYHLNAASINAEVGENAQEIVFDDEINAALAILNAKALKQHFKDDGMVDRPLPLKKY